MEICTFASGSSGNCTLVSSGETKLLVDAGISMRRIKSCLRNFDLTIDDLTAIVVTHEHSDHMKALRMIHKYHNVPIFAPNEAHGITYAYPELSGHIIGFDPGDILEIGALKVASIPTPHDVASVAFKITDGEKTVFIATDMGYITKNIYRAACGSDFAVLEANHDVQMLENGIYPYHLKQRILSDKGHLSNSECARLITALVKSGTKRFLLAHLSKENNTPALAAEAVRTALESEGFFDVHFDVAPADEMTDIYLI